MCLNVFDMWFKFEAGEQFFVWNLVWQKRQILVRHKRQMHYFSLVGILVNEPSYGISPLFIGKSTTKKSHLKNDQKVTSVLPAGLAALPIEHDQKMVNRNTIYTIHPNTAEYTRICGPNCKLACNPQ